MSDFERRYLTFVQDVVDFGEPRESRSGPTRSLFGERLLIGDMQNGFPILTTRKIYPRGIWGELAAFIAGATTLEQYTNLGCDYWHDNAANWSRNDSCPQAQWEVGKVYGAQWRNFNGIDQLAVLLNGLRKDPTSRRHLLTTYNPAELHLACLPPCHLLAQFQVAGTLDCCVYMRSVDLCLGLPSDIVLYATLLHLIARATDLVPGRLVFQFGDAHVYENHVDTFHRQLTRGMFPLPTLEMLDYAQLYSFANAGISLTNYNSHDKLTYQLNV